MPCRIAIIGRPNVGKSTLFNRIVGRRHSITEKKSGTTRDRISAVVGRGDAAIELVDTGGFGPGGADNISKLVKKQIEVALKEADIVLFVCDITQGVTSLDQEILPILRKSGRDIILAVNKADNEKSKEGISEFYSLGIKELYPISAMHNTGMEPLLSVLTKTAGSIRRTGVSVEAAIKVAIVGRPNVGKSSFVNKVIGEERVIVHEKPGTTRDSIDIYLKRDGKDYILIDTAGMRHKRKIKEAADVYGLLRARDSVRRCDVCLVMIDAYDGLRRDDMRILRLAEECGKGGVLLVNKWDLMPEFDMVKYQNALARKMNYVNELPVLFTSCKTGLNVHEAFSVVDLVYRGLTARYPEEEVGRILGLIKKGGKVPLVRHGKLINVRYMKQEDNTPPTFTLSVNKGAVVTGDYERGIRNILRRELGLTGVPIRLNIRHIRQDRTK